MPASQSNPNPGPKPGPPVGAEARRVRVVIAEDEPLGREKLLRILAGDPRVEVVGQAMTGRDAVDQVRALRPDILFLDVQLPGSTGFEVLAELGTDGPRAVVFVTAHAEFATRAFDLDVVDYVLKPLDKARVHAALGRAIERVSSDSMAELARRLAGLLAQVPSKTRGAVERFAIKTGGRILLVHPLDIDWVGSADDRVEVHVGGQVHTLSETMSAMEQRLPPDAFVRISRSTIVNRHRVREIQPLFHGQCAILLRDGTRLTLSRSHRDRLPRLGLG